MERNDIVGRAVCDHPIAGVTGLNPSEGMDVCLLLFVVWCVDSELITRTEESFSGRMIVS